MPRVRTSPQPHPIRNRQDDELARATGPAYDIWRGAIRRRDAARRSAVGALVPRAILGRSEEHTSELQSLMRISYAVFCLNKQTTPPPHKHQHNLMHSNNTTPPTTHP